MERRTSKVEEIVDTHGRLSSLETKSDALKDDISRLMTNHLPHLQEAIEDGRKENNANIEKLRVETKQSIDGLGNRFDRSLQNATDNFNATHKDSCEKTDKRLDRIGNQFWAIIILLVSAIISLATIHFK